MEAATGMDMLGTAMEVVVGDHTCEIPLEAWSWCSLVAEAAEAAVITDRLNRSANSTAYLWAALEADCLAVMGTVENTMQAGSEGVSPSRGRAAKATLVVIVEARAAVMKVATAISIMAAEVVVAVGTAEQAAVMYHGPVTPVVAALGTLAAA